MIAWPALRIKVYGYAALHVMDQILLFGTWQNVVQPYQAAKLLLCMTSVCTRQGYGTYAD